LLVLLKDTSTDLTFSNIPEAFSTEYITLDTVVIGPDPESRYNAVDPSELSPKFSVSLSSFGNNKHNFSEYHFLPESSTKRLPTNWTVPFLFGT
jgi:hypothetical protein